MSARFDAPRTSLIDVATERDLRRIATDRLIAPPLDDPDHPDWDASWSRFAAIYTPALERFAYHVLKRNQATGSTLQDAEDVVAEFLHARLSDGRLRSHAAPIRSFRNWIASQLARFTIDWLRRRGALRRRPSGGFEDTSRLEDLAGQALDPSDLCSFTEQLVAHVVVTVIDRIRAVNSRHAAILSDLILNDGVQSPRLHRELGVEASSMGTLRRRARTQFGKVVLELVQEGQFAERDLEELIGGLQRFSAAA